jgi:hypothetical protein
MRDPGAAHLHGHPLRRVRVRLCYAGHEESVVGIFLGDFENEYSGFSATYGFALKDWSYEQEGKSPLVNHTALFIKWESVFVIEELREPNFLMKVIKGGGNTEKRSPEAL